MPDVAALQLQADSKGIREAAVALREIGPAATAAEKAAQRWGMTTDAASRSADDFSKRVQGTIKSLEFERQQLTRTSAEQAKYAALRRAGVSAMSAEGQAIAASVAALQAQRVAAKGSAEATTLHGAAIRVAGSAASELVGHLKRMALAYISLEAARKLWEISLGAGDLGEQAEQIGINTDQLQAYRLAGAQAGIETEQMDTALTKLAKSMGAAADGNKEMIERFQQLGVKLLDAQGQLRPTADVLPEVAKGILGIGSSSQRTATLMDLFGKSGAKMATVLGDLAQGNDSVIASARQQNAIISPGAIEAWDTLGDRMKVTQQKWATLVGEFGAKFAIPGIEILNNMLESTKKELLGIQAILEGLAKNFTAARAAAVQAPFQNDVKNLQDRLAALNQNPSQFGFAASKKALTDQLAAAQDAASRSQNLANQAGMQQDEATARRGTLPVSAPPLGVQSTGRAGVSDPRVKGAGDAEAKAYQKIIDSAKDYIATKNAETAAIGMNVEAAARLKHETELTAKATNDKTAIDATQTAQLKALAQAMAEADAAFAKAKFMDDAVTKSNEFIAAQQIERDTLFMSSEAAAAYKTEQELLNKAKADGIVLTDAEKQKLHDLAGAQAAAGERTRQTKELVDLGRDAFQGFFSDLSNGLRQGQSAWDAFGSAATNALNKIADKLLSMAVDDLFNSAFGGKGSSGGGFLSGIFDSISGWLTGGMSGAGAPGSPYYGPPAALASANGNAFMGGNVIPFARGGIVTRPTLFPMANGMGLMGEAGPEGVIPLRRGRGGRLGVDASGMGGGGVVVNVINNADGTKATTRESKSPGGGMQLDVIVEAVEAKMSGRVSRGQGSLGKTFEGTYGLQRQGR